MHGGPRRAIHPAPKIIGQPSWVTIMSLECLGRPSSWRIASWVKDMPQRITTVSPQMDIARAQRPTPNCHTCTQHVVDVVVVVAAVGVAVSTTRQRATQLATTRQREPGRKKSTNTLSRVTGTEISADMQIHIIPTQTHARRCIPVHSHVYM